MVAARRKVGGRRRSGRPAPHDDSSSASDCIDYLFVAWNASTAFSPTDTLILSKRAKVLMMVQSVIALITVVVLAARAVNALR